MARKLTFRVHALERMFDRRISVEDVLDVLERGEIIEQYPDDQPYRAASCSAGSIRGHCTLWSRRTSKKIRLS